MPSSDLDLEQAKLDPGSVFARPDDVLSAPGLDREDRIGILKRWELDADALLRAGDEGMGDEPVHAELVRAVRKALLMLETQ